MLHGVYTHSGVGIVAAIAALAATLFSPEINNNYSKPAISYSLQQSRMHLHKCIYSQRLTRGTALAQLLMNTNYYCK